MAPPLPVRRLTGVCTGEERRSADPVETAPGPPPKSPRLAQEKPESAASKKPEPDGFVDERAVYVRVWHGAHLDAQTGVRHDLFLHGVVPFVVGYGRIGEAPNRECRVNEGHRNDAEAEAGLSQPALDLPRP